MVLQQTLAFNEYPLPEVDPRLVWSKLRPARPGLVSHARIKQHTTPHGLAFVVSCAPSTPFMWSLSAVATDDDILVQ